VVVEHDLVSVGNASGVGAEILTRLYVLNRLSLSGFLSLRSSCDQQQRSEQRNDLHGCHQNGVLSSCSRPTSKRRRRRRILDPEHIDINCVYCQNKSHDR
jgi:hypothetical protein